MTVLCLQMCWAYRTLVRLPGILRTVTRKLYYFQRLTVTSVSMRPLHLLLLPDSGDDILGALLLFSPHLDPAFSVLPAKPGVVSLISISVQDQVGSSGFLREEK